MKISPEDCVKQIFFWMNINIFYRLCQFTDFGNGSKIDKSIKSIQSKITMKCFDEDTDGSDRLKYIIYELYHLVGYSMTLELFRQMKIVFPSYNHIFKKVCISKEDRIRYENIRNWLIILIKNPLIRLSLCNKYSDNKRVKSVFKNHGQVL